MTERLVKLTRKKEPRTGDERSMPTRQAQDEVLNGLGAEVDEESGEVLVDEGRMREVGAVDVDAVRENQRRDEYIRQKKDGKKKVPFNTPNVLARYEMVLTQFPASTLNIFVQRLTGGAPAQYTITSRPNSGVELYAAMQKIHGTGDSAEYELNIQDAHQRTWRGTGRITMPDTRDQATTPQQLPPQPYFAPPQAAPVAAPAAAPPAPASGGLDTIALVEQMFNLFQRMTPAAPAAVAAPATPAAPTAAMFAQVAPLLSDPSSQVEGLGKLFDLFQKAQAAQAAPTAAAPPPTVQAPPGMVHVPGVGFVTAEYLAQALAGREPATQPAPRRPYVPPRREDPRGYDPRDDREERGPNRFGRDSGYEPRYDRGYDPRDRDPRYDPRPRYDDRGPPRERSPLSELRTAMTTVREMQELLGASGGNEREATGVGDPDDEDNPFQVIESGGAKLLADKDTGKVRIMESLAINAPAAFKWIGEQAQAITKAAEQQRAQQQQALPEPARRFVEVIDPPLPPPPDRVPPPISPSGWEDSAPEMPFGAEEG